MPTSTTVEALQDLLIELLRCVTSLHSSVGDSPAMRRVVNDVEAIRNGIHRLQIDAEELGTRPATTPCTRSSEMIKIPDAEYDADFWRDVDHEGVGAQSLAGIRPRP